MTKNFSSSASRGEQLEAELAELEAIKNGEKTAPTEEIEPTEAKKGWEKRYSDLRSFSQKKENELRKEIDTLKGQLSDAVQKQVKFPKSKEEVKAWLSKYPDVGAIVETIALEKVEALRGEMAEKEANVLKRSYEVEFDRCLNRITSAHNDFFEIREDDAFAEWLEKQPKYVRNAFEADPSYDELDDMADTVISALELYKFKTKPVEKKSDDRREAAKSVTRTTNASPRSERDPNQIFESDIAKMNIREYEKNEAEIMKAMREGRVVYDLSGAAR